MFLLLSTLTALLECGPLFLKFCGDICIWQRLALCLAYQFGNLFPLPFCLNKKTLTIVNTISIVALCFACSIKNYPILQWLLYFVTITCIAIPLQSTRGLLKKKESTVRKRCARVVGFLLAPLMCYIPFVMGLFCCLATLFAIHYVTDSTENTVATVHSYNLLRENSYYIIMLWHQLHYFIYAYAAVLYIYQKLHQPSLTMMLFACTWLTYLITEPLILRVYQHITKAKELTKQGYMQTIIIGHLLLTLLLILLPCTSSVNLFSLLWILTGFGGGTVFAITALCKRSHTYHKEHLNIVENIGHLTGTFIAVVFLCIFPQGIQYLPYLSALCAAVVLILTLKQQLTKHIITNERKNNDESQNNTR